MAINTNREQKRLDASEVLLKKAEGESEIARLAIIVQKQKDALEKQNSVYPRLLKRHLRKCKKFGWTDGRLNNKKN